MHCGNGRCALNIVRVADRVAESEVDGILHDVQNFEEVQAGGAARLLSAAFHVVRLQGLWASSHACAVNSFTEQRTCGFQMVKRRIRQWQSKCALKSAPRRAPALALCTGRTMGT